jgi:DNA-binding XRE family transcriptional regulator
LSKPELRRIDGKKFQEIRFSLLLSDKLAAAALDVDVRTVRRWESGERPLPAMAGMALKYLEHFSECKRFTPDKPGEKKRGPKTDAQTQRRSDLLRPLGEERNLA